MSADQGAVVLSGLPEDAQAEVAHRLAVMDRTSPEIVKQVEAHLERRLSTVLQSSDYSAVGGLQPLVDIINHSDRSTERLILQGLEERDSELAEEVRAQMFMFEDIVTLDDRSVQVLLRQVDSKDLGVALKGVRPDVRDKIVRNMSERAGTALLEDMEVMGPVRLKQVEEAQAIIVRHIRELEEAGEILISRGGNDEFVL
jgi:flagellar motor switch protein FliG